MITTAELPPAGAAPATAPTKALLVCGAPNPNDPAGVVATAVELCATAGSGRKAGDVRFLARRQWGGIGMS
jgi:hypothetical protein